MLEWPENIRIKDDAPADYFPPLFTALPPQDRTRHVKFHALPDGWENMPYEEFFEKRRKLMAEVIKKGFDAVGGASSMPPGSSGLTFALLAAVFIGII